MRLPLNLLDKDFGKELNLTFRDKNFLRRRRMYPFLFGRSPFKNIIVESPFCRHAFGGREFYLINTDPYHDYRVTLRLHWQQGSEEGEVYMNIISKAGSKIFLGCEASPTFPAVFRAWEVVSEVVLSTCWVE